MRDYQLRRAESLARFDRLLGKVDDLSRRMQASLRRRLDDDRVRVGQLGSRMGAGAARTLDTLDTKAREAERLLGRTWSRLGQDALGQWTCTRPSWRHSGALSDRDRRLAGKWPEQGKVDRPRLESARFAELAAVAYYERLELKVEDVSILELDGTDDRWVTHDIEVDSRGIDVKSTILRDDRFRDFFWKRTKKANGNPVPIVGVGVWDDPVHQDRSQDDPPRELHGTVLGEAHEGPVKDLFERVVFSATQALNLRFESYSRAWSLRGESWFPPWLFDFPGDHYGDLVHVGDVHRWQRIAEDFGDTVPHWLAAIAAASCGDVQETELLSLQGKLIHELAKFSTSIGRSEGVMAPFGRPQVFLFTLLQLLARPVRETVDALRDCIFVDQSDDGKEHPLGRDDPLRQVWHLLHNVQRLLEHNPNVLRQAESFRLARPAILQAKLDGTWRTILAYCGNCGKAPLWLGPGDQDGGCEWCVCTSSVRRLLCDECGSCGLDNCDWSRSETVERRAGHDHHACPQRTVAGPTQKQLKFIDTLRRERRSDGLDDVRPKTRDDASKLIDDLKARPRRLP